jgi:putative DNA primase/helicase
VGNQTSDRYADIAPEGGRARKGKARPKPIPSADADNRTDLGNAGRMVRRHGDNFRHCHPWRKDLIWVGTHWREDDTAQIEALAKDTVRSIYAEAEKAEDDGRRTALGAHAIRSEDARRIRAMIALTRSEPGIPIVPGDMDVDPFLLNVANGTIDLRTGKLRDHRRGDLITKIAPVEYQPDATCPLWEKFLARIFDDNRDLTDYLRRVVGYSLTGRTDEQCLFFFHGGGANGKSVFLLTIKDMLGDYACQAVSELLMAKQSDTHPTERADLFGRRFVATIEVDEGKRIAESLMKQLTGGDTVKARKMRQDFFSMTPTWKLFLAANHKPAIRGQDLAVWRRIKLIPFNVTIPEEERDKRLADKLRAEWPGILAWAVRGRLEWQLAGLGEPDEVRQATTAYQAEQDTLSEFLAAECFLNPNVRCRNSLLLDAYKEWSGDRWVTQKAFSKKLEDKGYKSEKGSGGYHFWLGIGLPEPEPAKGR